MASLAGPFDLRLIIDYLGLAIYTEVLKNEEL